MQLRRIGSHRGIEYIVRITDRGLRYAMIDAHGLTAVVYEEGTELPSLEDIQKQIDVYLDECALEWE